MKVAFAADHAGYELKVALVARARGLGHDVLDLGTHGPESVDYPDYGAACGRAVGGGDVDLAVAVCGTGLGIALAAAKVPGCRAVTCHDAFTAEMARRHNDANVMALGARIVDAARALAMLETFLATPFDGGRHARRVEKIGALETDAR